MPVIYLPPPITRQYVVRIAFAVEDGYLRIRSAVTATDTGQMFPEEKGVSFPLEFFNDAKGELNQPLLQDFCKRLGNSVVPLTVDQAIFRDFAFHIIHCAHLLAVRMKVSNETYESVIPKLAKFHTSVIIARLKSLTGQQTTGAGRHAHWSADTLALSIVVAMRKIKNPKLRSYPQVAKHLNDEFPEAFKSQDASALKKLVSRYSLNWEELKQRATLTDSELLLTLPSDLAHLIKTIPASIGADTVTPLR